jgi:hypothetical protein
MSLREMVTQSLIAYARADARRYRHQVVVFTQQGIRSYCREKGAQLVPSVMAQAFAKALES